MTQKNSSGRERRSSRRRRSVLEFASKEEKKLLTGPASLEIWRLSELISIDLADLDLENRSTLERRS